MLYDAMEWEVPQIVHTTQDIRKALTERLKLIESDLIFKFYDKGGLNG